MNSVDADRIAGFFESVVYLGEIDSVADAVAPTVVARRAASLTVASTSNVNEFVITKLPHDNSAPWTGHTVEVVPVCLRFEQSTACQRRTSIPEQETRLALAGGYQRADRPSHW